MTTEHTATPWRVGNHPNDDSGLNWREILTDALEFSPSYVGQMQKQDAEFAVRAVNAHDALVDESTQAVARLFDLPAFLHKNGHQVLSEIVADVLTGLRAALKLAQDPTQREREQTADQVCGNTFAHLHSSDVATTKESPLPRSRPFLRLWVPLLCGRQTLSDGTPLRAEGDSGA